MIETLQDRIMVRQVRHDGRPLYVARSIYWGTQRSSRTSHADAARAVARVVARRSCRAVFRLIGTVAWNSCAIYTAEYV
jgi:hypothetical protein